MTRVHDMGGRFGDGPVEPDAPDAPVFEEHWHGRALALTLASAALGKWNLDMSRHARERLSPKDYTRFGYYEKWIAGLADLLVEREVLSRDDLVSDTALEPHALAGRALKPGQVAGVLARGGPADRPSDISAKFRAGDSVVTRRPAANHLVSGGHTRLPAYAQGATGTVLRCHGAHVLPDSNAHDLGEAAEPLYAVVFAASDLWAQPEHSGDEVILDLWQSYLEPA